MFNTLAGLQRRWGPAAGFASGYCVEALRLEIEQ